MSSLASQIVGLVMLLVGIGLADRLLQRSNRMTGAQRQARLLALMTGVGGLVGAVAWWQNVPFAFAWTLPQVAARFLAVAGVAFGIAALRAAWIGSTGHLRLIASMLAVYLGPLAIAALTLHLDRFDPNAPITYAFFAIVAVMLVAAIATLLRLPANERGMSSGALTVIGATAGLWGVVLFLWPNGPIHTLWPWPDDPLTTRLIASMFLTVATACLLAEGRAERETAQILCTLYSTGIVGATILAAATGKPGSSAYLVYWTLVGITAIRSWINRRATLPRHGPSHPD
ncbi:MAG: hypothetical protein ABI832_22040 [bacterium]